MDEFRKHYYKVKPKAQRTLAKFEKMRQADDKFLFEELTFCIFAANSSAKMGLKAQKLLKPVLHDGSLKDYQKAVYKKVRFYNVRSKYLYKNKLFIENQGGLTNILRRFNDVKKLRMYLRRNIKGFGMKESSHFLRNIGFTGLTIIDKHVSNTMFELSVFNSPHSPKSDNEYLKKEEKIYRFANTFGFCVDILDLAVWSYNTGEIIK